MKRKHFILALVAMLSSFSMTTYAQHVAKVGNTEYATIDEAIANWTNGTTLTLLADVTLSDVIKLSTTEHHILDLGTYTMTAASGKDAIQYVINGRSSASYALDIKADATNPGGITATGASVVRHTKPLTGAPSKDRPITRFYGGVFNASYVVRQGGTFGAGYTGASAPHFYFYGGEYNGTIYTNRSIVQFHGGVFNGSIQMSVDSSSYGLVAGGTFKNLSNLMGSALNSDKFTIGSAKGVYDKEVYIDDNGNTVIAAAEPSEGIEAAVAKTPSTNDYLAYSKVATEGALNYTDVYMALEGNKTAEVTVYTEELDLEGSSFTGTIVIPAGNDITITNVPADATVMLKNEDGTTKELIPNEDGTIRTVVAKIGDTSYSTLAAAIAGATAGQTITLVADINENVTISKNLTIDGAGQQYTGNIAVKGNSVAATVKNVNFVDGSGYAITTNTIKSITVENCTVNNYGYGFLYANKSTPTVTVKNVTVDGGNYGFHWVYGTTATLENVKMTNVTNGLYIQNYAGKTINLKNCEICSIGIWERSGYSGVQTFNFEGVNEVPSLPTSSYAKIGAGVQIGTKIYGTLDAAFAAAQDGDEVKVLTAGTYALSTSGKDITITGAVDGVVFDNIGAKNMGSANVTFNNVTFDYYPNVNYTGLQHSGNLVYNNCTINGQVFLYGQSETFNKCTFNQNSADAYNVWTYGAKEVDFNECTFNSVGKSVLVYTESKTTTNDVAFTKCGLNASAPVDGKAAIEIDTSLSAGATITVDGATTATGFGAGSVSGNPLWNNKKGNADAANNDVTVVVNNETVLAPIPDVAKIGETGYRTFAEAIAAIGAGDVVIELLADATFDYNARDAYGTAETTSVTINGNGKTLTLNQKNSDWASIGLANGKLVLKNMTIEKTGYGDTSGAWNTHAIIFSCPVEMTDVEVNNGIAVQAGATLTNVTINEANGYYGLWVNGNGQAVTVNGGEINATNGGRGIKVADQYIEAPAKVTLSVTGTKFSTAKKAAVLVSSKAGADIAASNVNIENVAEDNVNFVWVDEDWAQYFANVTVTGATVAQESMGDFAVTINNSAYFKTLAEAIAAAKAGETVTLLADINENVTISKSLTIDGAGKQYTGKMTGNKGLTVTIQNVNFVNGGFDKPKTQSSTTGTYTFKNCTFDGAGTYAYPLSIRGANKIIVEDCSVKNYRYSFLYVVSSALNVSVKNVTVEDCPNYAVYFASGVTTATFEGLTVKNSDNGFLINNTANRSFTIKDCKMENVITAINHANGTSAINCTALGLNDFGTAAMSEYAVIKAQAQSGSLYGDLTSVVEAAEADATVTLLANATGAGAVIDKNLTIDFGGKTYTFNQTVGSTGTTTLGFQILKGNDVTLKNGTLTSTAAVMGSKEVKVLIQNYANLTLEDMNLIDNTEHIQYALSNNSGNTVIKGNTNITTDAVAFDVYDYTSGGYAVPTVTVETTGTIDGKIEVSESINDNLQIKSGIYTMDVNEWCAPGFICKANEDGKYGIEKANFKLNDTYYATLDEAIAAIGAGDNVIELLADATFNYGAREAYGTEETTSVTINGNGHTLTLNQTNSDWSSFGLAAGKVAFNNVTIEKVGYGDTNGAWNTHAIIFSSPVEMTDVTVNQSMAVQAGATLKNVTINEANGFYGLWINGNGQAVTVDGGAINATNGGRGIKIADQYIASPAQVTLSVTGTKFSTAKKAAVLVSSKAGAAITAENVDITEVAEDNVNFVWVDEDWAASYGNVEVTGATVALESMGDFAVTINNSAYFKTLAEAITAATAGQTITFLADINESVTLSKNVNIDGAGKQYTGTISISGSSNTIKNVNFVGTADLYYAFAVRSAKKLIIEDCTVKNYNSGFLYNPKASTNISVKNVTVEDCPSYAVYFSTGVTTATFENLTVKNANNGLLINNTAVRNLTIKDCTMENVTTAINHSKGTYKINCTARGFNDFGGAAMSEYVNFTAEAKAGAVVGDFAGVVAAAQENATVTLLSDITLTTATYAEQNDGYAVLVNAEKSMTIDLNGKAVTVNAAKADLTATKGKMLLAVFHAEPGAHLTLDDSSAEGTANVTLNVNDASVYSMFSTESPSGTTSGKLTVNGGNYTTVGKLSNAMFFTDCNDAVVINGGNFYCDGATTSSKYPWMVNTLGNNELSVLVTGGTFNTDINHQHRPFEVEIDKELALRDNGDGTWTIVPAVAYITEMLGSTVDESGSHEHNVGYATLADAIDAAKAEGTVTLVADAAGAGVVINKNVTIDFNEKTYTFNEGVGSTGTESNGFQILKGNDVTLKNGTLNVAAEAAGKFYILVQNYANLTVEDMTLDGTNLDKWSLTDGDSYVLSNNSGNVLVTGNTNITANNDGDKAFAFDACTKAGYDAPVVTVETTGKIAGKIENSATIAIKSGTYTTPILPEWCAQYYAPVDNGDGTYGVVYTYVDEMTIDDDKYYKGEMPAEGFVNKNEQTVGTLTYKRTFNKANVWQALYVPFEIPVAYLSDLGYEVAYLYDVHNKVVAGEEIDPAAIESVHFVKITKGTLRASYPYIIRPTSEADLTLSLTLYDAKLYSTDKKNDVESSTTTTRYIFTGTYADAYSTDITGNANIPCLRINSSGKWQKMSATAILVPFRICMYIVNKDGSPVIMSDEAAKSIQIRIIGEENEDGTTTIYDVEADEQTVDYIYDLQGRRVLEPQKGGLYIVNGKKVVF